MEKKPFPEAYNMIYDKLETFEKYKKNNNEEVLPQRMAFHLDCRYSMKINLNIDLDSEEDSD